MIIKLDIEEARIIQLITYLAQDGSLGTWELLKDIKDQYETQVPREPVTPAAE